MQRVEDPTFEAGVFVRFLAAEPCLRTGIFVGATSSCYVPDYYGPILTV